MYPVCAEGVSGRVAEGGSGVIKKTRKGFHRCSEGGAQGVLQGGGCSGNVSEKQRRFS